VFTERERLKLAEVKRAKRRAQVAGAKSAAERNSRKPQDYRWQTNKTRRISARERSRSCRLRAGRESRCWLDFITYACRHVCGEVGGGLAAACHFVASLPDYPHSRNIVQPPLIEYDVGDNALCDSIFKEPILVENGACVLPNRPGLGVELDPVAIRRFNEP
jgi:hypothetical protein